MADVSEKDNASRARITNHMNADHHDSIARYLEHYAHKSTWEASSGRMTAIDLSSMTLATTHSNQIKIPFTPPLTSYAQARERLVELDRECVAALKRSDVSIREFVPATATWTYGVEFTTIAVIMAAFCRRTLFGETGVVATRLGLPGFARFCWVVQPFVWWFIVVAHVAEALLFMRLLKKHSVSPRSSTYWKWCATTLVEGGFAMMRFQGLVQQTREANAKRKH